MPAYTYAGGQYPVAGDSLSNLQADLQALATSIAPRSVPSFADTTARNAAYAADIAAGKQGMRCWIVNRGGYCFYNGSAWVWEPQRNQIYDGYRGSAVETAISTPGSMGVGMGSVVALPPGNRLLHVAWGAVVQNISSPANRVAPRVSPMSLTGLTISGLPDGRNYAQATLPVEMAGTGFTTQVSNQAFLVLAGNVGIQLLGLSANGSSTINNANAVRFTNSWLTVYDLGPSDD